MIIEKYICSECNKGVYIDIDRWSDMSTKVTRDYLVKTLCCGNDMYMVYNSVSNAALKVVDINEIFYDIPNKL